MLLADSATANRISPSIAAACGRVEIVSTVSSVVAQLRMLREKGLRVSAVLVAGDSDTASSVFESVASECGDSTTAMIYLPSERARQNLAESISQNERVVTITATSAPRLLRNAIHAATAAQDADSAQVIDLAQVLAVQRVSRRILVAEDNATNRTIIAQLLENAGHKVLIAEDGEEALDIFERDAPDLAVPDFNMHYKMAST